MDTKIEPNMENELVVKKKVNIKTILILIVYELIFIVITGCGLVFYGPFTNIRNNVVESAMTSLNHKYIVQFFLSDKTIQDIRQEDKASTIVQNTKSDIKIAQTESSVIDKYEIKSDKFSGYMLVVHNPKKVRVGYTNKLGVEGELTSQIAKDNNAVAAINAGGFSDKTSGSIGTGTGGQPSGVIISNGRLIFPKSLGKSNKKMEIVGITDDGRLLVGKYSSNDIARLNVKEAVHFGPALVVNGQPTIKSGIGGWGTAPRTAIGQRHDGAILMLVIDGRRLSSLGATLRDVQNIMLQYKAENASNLDGGSSTTMYYNGKIINNPCDSLGERAVPTAFIVEK